MKTWHLGLVLALVVAYLVGVKFPSVGAGLLSKVGL